MIKHDFKSRIIALTLSVVFLSGLAIGAAVLWNFDSLSSKTLHNRVLIEAQIVSQNIASSVLFDDTVTAAEILSTISADPAVQSVTLRTPTNPEFASYVQQNLLAEPTGATSTLMEPIIFEGQEIGQLVLVVSHGEIYAQNIASALYIVLVIVVVFVLVTLLVYPIVRSLLSQLIQLHQVSENIATTRNYSLRATISTDDEIGRLSRMFNHMVEQIEYRDAMLEKKVVQRTAELEKLAEEFRFRAFHDSLTGLPNRALLYERFEYSIEHAQRYKNRFACLLLDLDDFKTINDTKGHEFGDELLINVAQRLKKTVRGEDLVCRLGGDEFVLLLNDLRSVDDAELIARQILAQLNREFQVMDEKIRTAASIGGAVYPDHGDNLSTIKRHADVAMYRAKEEGKNRFCLFSDGMQEEVRYRLMIQSDLQTGLKKEQFEVYLQPKVDPSQRQVVGCEALVRWNHPKEGFLTPNKFIPYAEEIGVVADIDYFVIRRCCELILEWSGGLMELIPIAFNLSGRHFRDFKIVGVLKKALEDSAIDPAFLEVEITEAVLIEDPEKAKSVVLALRELGLCISLDDFGTGYSSLNYLRTLPIDIVKLDRSFVCNLDHNAQDRRLTRGIVSLAKGLNLRLVAEGVETEAQMNALLELGCTVMQGYYFLKPVANQEFMLWYKTHYPHQEKPIR